MDFVKLFFRKKQVKILFCILAIGIMLLALPYYMSNEQCPSSYTQQQINSSNCIVGANIGSGLIRLSGIFAATAALAGLSAILIAAISPRFARIAAGLLICGIFLLIIGYVTAPLSNSEEIYKTAKCSADDRTNIQEMNEEYCQYPNRSPLAVTDYTNYKMKAGVILFFAGTIISVYSILRHK